MKEEEYFTIKCNTDPDNPEFYIVVEFMDSSEKIFKDYEWLRFRDGVKKNLYDRGMVKHLSKFNIHK